MFVIIGSAMRVFTIVSSVAYIWWLLYVMLEFIFDFSHKRLGESCLCDLRVLHRKFLKNSFLGLSNFVQMHHVFTHIKLLFKHLSSNLQTFLGD